MKINLEKDYPKIANAIEEKDLDELRYFVIADENYVDIDDEEVDVFEPENYNFLVYVTERLGNALKEEGLRELIAKLYEVKEFENFLDSELDLYGVKSKLNDDEVAKKVLALSEEILGAKSWKKLF